MISDFGKAYFPGGITFSQTHLKIFVAEFFNEGAQSVVAEDPDGWKRHTVKGIVLDHRVHRHVRKIQA